MNQKEQRNVLKGVGADFSDGYQWSEYDNGFIDIDIDADKLVSLGYSCIISTNTQEVYSNGVYVITIDNSISHIVRAVKRQDYNE
jgi:hypothetical protein